MTQLPVLSEHILVDGIRGDELKIKPVGDVHLGNPYFDHALFEQTLRELEDEDRG